MCRSEPWFSNYGISTTGGSWAPSCGTRGNLTSHEVNVGESLFCKLLFLCGHVLIYFSDNNINNNNNLTLVVFSQVGYDEKRL